MRRADRLFRIVQMLRSGRLKTARALAERLQVSERTIYRDVRDLQLRTELKNHLERSLIMLMTAGANALVALGAFEVDEFAPELFEADLCKWRRLGLEEASHVRGRWVVGMLQIVFLDVVAYVVEARLDSEIGKRVTLDPVPLTCLEISRRALDPDRYALVAAMCVDEVERLAP